jgi:hypothetical protein
MHFKFFSKNKIQYKKFKPLSFHPKSPAPGLSGTIEFIISTLGLGLGMYFFDKILEFIFLSNY